VGLPPSPVEFSSLRHSHKVFCSWLLGTRPCSSQPCLFKMKYILILFTLYHSLFLSLLLLLPSNSPAITIMFYINIYIHIYTHIFVFIWSCLYLWIHVSFVCIHPHMRENMQTLFFWTWLSSLNMMSFYGKLCLLIKEFNPFTFKIIIDNNYWLLPFPHVFYMLYSFLFFISCITICFCL
jgi:hypothetical protein